MRNRRRLCSVVGVVVLALLVIAYHVHPKGVSQAAEESGPALRVERAEAPGHPTPTTGREAWPVRWVCLGVNFGKDDGSTTAGIQYVEDWSTHGLTGVVLVNNWFPKLAAVPWGEGGFNKQKFKANLARFLSTCQTHGIEVAPYVTGPSRGNNGLLAHNPNLASGYKVEKALFVVGTDGIHRLKADPPVSLENGGFEDADTDGVFEDWYSQDAPCQAVCPDDETAYSGDQSARLNGEWEGLARLSQYVDVEPHRYYHISVQLKTEDLQPEDEDGKTHSFNILVWGMEGSGHKNLVWNSFEPEATQDWTEVHTVFNSLDYAQIKVYFGLWGATDGEAWLDDAKIEEIGLMNVLRRDGCPLTVTSLDEQTTYREGRDYKYVEDPKLGQNGWAGRYYRWYDKEEHPGIEMLNPSGHPEQVRVSFYHPLVIHKWQVDCCLTEPAMYTVFEDAIEELVEWLDEAGYTPNYYMLGTDEYRTGASCATCKGTQKTAGQLLGECVTEYADIVQEATSNGVEVLVFGDMFDPNHNAHDDYFLVEGSLDESWEWLDEDIVVVPWYYPIRDASLAHFSTHGFYQIGSVSIPSDPLQWKRVDRWRTSIEGVEGTKGLLYVTWSDPPYFDAVCYFLKRLQYDDPQECP